MLIIDADTHVDETENTWAYMEQGEQQFRPTTGYPKDQDPSRPPIRYWLVDGKRQIRFIRNDQQTKTTVETRELIDVDARLRDMDRMGVDIQVMYPTLFLVESTDRPEVGLALRRSYNRWMADRCARSGGRLRWVMLPPTMTMDKALEEVRFAKDHGACGVLKKGDREAGFWVNDPYFFPLYEEAQRLDIPICFHTGSGVPDFTPAREFTFSRLYRIMLPVVHAFHSLILHGVPAQFPRLRFGFIEATASWVPFVLYDLRRNLENNRRHPDSPLRGATQNYEVPEDVLTKNRMYVSCQVDEDLGYIMEYTGEDNLLMGSDYTHNDAAQGGRGNHLMGGINNWDISIRKRTTVFGEGRFLEVGADFINAFNHPSYTIGSGGVFGLTTQAISNTAYITPGATGFLQDNTFSGGLGQSPFQRVIQLSLKFGF